MAFDASQTYSFRRRPAFLQVLFVLGVSVLARPVLAQDTQADSEQNAADASAAKGTEATESTPQPATEGAAQDSTGADSGAGEPSEQASQASEQAASEPTSGESDADAPGGSSDAATESQPSEAEQASPNYDMKLRGIEERVNQLKEKIYQSKARLMQLQEVVLHGSITGSKAVLVHRNEMGSSFKLRRVQYALDGAPIFNRVDTDGALSDKEEIEIFNGSIAPGNHQISVFMEYRGHGYGVFSYLKGYKFRIKSSYTFTAEEGKLTTVKIVGYEQGGLTTPLEERPAVRYDIETTRELRAAERSGEESVSASSPTQ